jgi:hypothetical protein
MQHRAIEIALILLLSCCGRACATEPAADAKHGELKDPMDMLLAVESARYETPDHRSCEKVARTKEFDLWVQAFGRADESSAEKYWGDVMVDLKNLHCKDIIHLLAIASQRTALLEGNDNSTHLLQHLLNTTEHKLGTNDAYTACCCKFMAQQCEGAKDYALAVNYRKKQMAILDVIEGKNARSTAQTRARLERDMALLNASRHGRH